jgi:Ca-activated chloride channel family protein
VALATAAAAPSESAEPGVRIVVPANDLLTGKLRVEALPRGTGVAAVAFTLDGKPVMTKKRPPFGAELDLGRTPRLHRVGAIALDAAGAELGRDEALVNGGPHRFAVRLVEPRAIPEGADHVEARAAVDLPEGESLDRVEFHVNDRLYATLYQEPWTQALPLPRGARVAWIRVVAYLADGGAAEDVRLVGSGEMTTAIDVDFVELYASMLDRRGRFVEGLTADDVEVRENGKPQVVRRFEPFADLPIHAGVMLDTSASMAEELAEAERAAQRFFAEVLSDRDRACVLTFADEPRLAVRFTRSPEVLAGGLAGLEARGETRLWDAVAYALHYFSGIRGKRAIVLLTDGLDSGSKFRFEEVLEYARRTGVAIYVVGLDVPLNPPDAGMLIDRLARETGGRSFRISRALELGPVYRDIQRELRAQYLIAYQSDGTGEGFREIELRVKRPGVEVRTVRGYYP